MDMENLKRVNIPEYLKLVEVKLPWPQDEAMYVNRRLYGPYNSNVFYKIRYGFINTYATKGNLQEIRFKWKV